MKKLLKKKEQQKFIIHLVGKYMNATIKIEFLPHKKIYASIIEEKTKDILGSIEIETKYTPKYTTIPKIEKEIKNKYGVNITNREYIDLTHI